MNDSKMREFRGDIEIRATEEKPRRIGGYAAVYYDGSAGSEYELWTGGPMERVVAGAFDKAVREDDVRALRDHDSSALLGRTKSGTLRLSTDSRGLKYEIDLPDTSVGRDVFESVRRGDMTESSFAFEITDEEWKKEGGKRIREIKGVRLFDVSCCAFGAYKGASVGIRVGGDLTEARAALAKVEESEAASRAQADIDQAQSRARCLEIGV